MPTSLPLAVGKCVQFRLIAGAEITKFAILSSNNFFAMGYMVDTTSEIENT